ncbi:hypothetical protein BDK51DRAFT_40805 [Blyttiomyces helicus]|uniref:F-box domain-containing protein n=1 Tax=Blyttiomyces helicus TaxID=388810 RepID=A0A4P9WDI6_9FUNG|nr:hypothetical protein BDK51DRAFT_40805 [Blyttiomyces helicus]|eukprot:RKO89785.1 hypothetical protein BDK51DRAFT_40805 [Blyttiomyces helicus]
MDPAAPPRPPQIPRLPVRLPVEIIEQIIHYLLPQVSQLVAPAQACRVWYTVCIPLIWRRFAPLMSGKLQYLPPLQHLLRAEYDTMRNMVINVAQRGSSLNPILNFSSNFLLIQEVDLSASARSNPSPDAQISDNLLTFLVNCTKLRRLEVAGCANVKGSAFGLILSVLPSLTRLSIANCDRIRTLADELSQCGAPLAIVNMSGLHDLTDVNESVREVFLQCSRTLEVLVLDWSELPGKGEVYLRDRGADSHLSEDAFISLDDLPPMEHLRELSLSRCTLIGDNVLRHLLPHRGNLETLRLDYCLQTTPFTLTLFLTGCPHLRILDLSDTPSATDAVVSTVATACPHLQWLALRGTLGAVTDASLQSLAAHSTDLRALSLNMNVHVTWLALVHLARACARLEALALVGCVQMIDTPVGELFVEFAQGYDVHCMQFHGRVEIARVANLDV